MRTLFTAALVFIGFAAPTLLAADTTTLLTAKEVHWTDLPEPPGAKQAQLWSKAGGGDSATLVKWKFNTKVPNVVRDKDVHILVLAGTFSIDVDGQYKEFGPGGYLSIAKGVKHSMGCEAAGECTFLVHEAGVGP